jgi:hypothetical protein
MEIIQNNQCEQKNDSQGLLSNATIADLKLKLLLLQQSIKDFAEYKQ